MGNTGFAERRPDLGHFAPCVPGGWLPAGSIDAASEGIQGKPLKGHHPGQEPETRRLNVHQADLWGWRVSQPATGTLTEHMLS